MGSYRIYVRQDDRAEEFRVAIHDETERALAEMGALSEKHAQKVARDLVTLVRRRDPKGDFTLDASDRQFA